MCFSYISSGLICVISDPCLPLGSVVNVTNFQWLVGTAKDLTVSNVFLLSIYIEGGTVVEGTSHYFNISSKSVKSATTTSSSTSSSTTSSSIFEVPSSTESPVTTATSTTSTTAPPTANSNGLSQGATIGLGVGVPCAVALGVAVGWFFFGRRRRSQQVPQNHTPYDDSNRDAMSMGWPEHSSVYTTTQHGQLYGQVPRQSSPRAEMTGQPKPPELQEQFLDYELSGNNRMNPHYELYAPGPERPRMNSF